MTSGAGSRRRRAWTRPAESIRAVHPPALRRELTPGAAPGSPAGGSLASPPGMLRAARLLVALRRKRRPAAESGLAEVHASPVAAERLPSALLQVPQRHRLSADQPGHSRCLPVVESAAVPGRTARPSPAPQPGQHGTRPPSLRPPRSDRSDRLPAHAPPSDRPSPPPAAPCQPPPPAGPAALHRASDRFASTAPFPGKDDPRPPAPGHSRIGHPAASSTSSPRPPWREPPPSPPGGRRRLRAQSRPTTISSQHSVICKVMCDASNASVYDHGINAIKTSNASVYSVRRRHPAARPSGGGPGAGRAIPSSCSSMTVTRGGSGARSGCAGSSSPTAVSSYL